MFEDTKKEIVICHSCKGIGIYPEYEIMDYNTSELNTIEEYVCSICNGKGRLNKITTISYERI